jgi:hypothetical protein
MSVEYGLLERWRHSQMCQSAIPEADDYPRRFLELIESGETLDQPRADESAVVKLVPDDR